MAINMMKQGGYRDAYAAALTASTAILGPIIPPSIIMIVYAMTDSNVTVTGLFLAGVVPGLVLAGSLMITNHIISVKRGYRLTPDQLDKTPVGKLFWRALPALMLPALILGGIQFGIFTPTEASAAAEMCIRDRARHSPNGASRGNLISNQPQ